MASRIIGILTKVLPWFKKYIWPLIEAHLISMLNKLIEDLFEFLRRERKQRENKYYDEAKNNFYEAGEDYKNAETEEGRNIAEKWARRWRDAAKGHKDEIDQMDEYFEKLKLETEEKIKNTIKESPKDLKVTDKGNVTFLGESIALPPSARDELE